jgi:hypothetical protein
MEVLEEVEEEEAGVVRAVLDEFAERVDGVVADEEDFEPAFDAWRRDILGSRGRGESACVVRVDI